MRLPRQTFQEGKGAENVEPKGRMGRMGRWRERTRNIMRRGKVEEKMKKRAMERRIITKKVEINVERRKCKENKKKKENEEQTI